MSQAEELLNGISEDEAVGTEPHIVIRDDRVIVVPDELKRIAVQFDNNIETVTFDCPRYWDEHDMSTMTVYINYMRADGMPGSYKAENVRVDEIDDTIMHFDWTISRNVSEVKGSLAILVCAKSVDDDGNEQNHWNSEMCKDMYISGGFECGESIAEQYPDVITQILTSVDQTYNPDSEKAQSGKAVAEAVREQVSRLHSDLGQLSSGGGSNTIYPSLTDGSVDYTNGEVSDDSAGGIFKRTDYINLGVLKTVSIKHNFWGYSTKGFAFFDKNKMFISGYLYVMELNETDIPDNAAYIMFTTHDLEKEHTEEKYVTIESVVGFAEEIKSEIAGAKKQIADITQDISVTKDIVSNIDDMVIEAVTPYPNEYESATRIQSSVNRICVLESMPLSLKGLIELEVYNGLSTEVTTQVYLLNEKYTVLDVINIQIPAGVGKHTISTTLYSDGSKTVFVGIKDTSAFLCATGKSGYPWGWTDIVTPSIGDVLTITRQIPSNDLAVTPIIKCPANTERITRIEDTLEDTLAQGNKNKFVHYSLDDCLFWVDLIKNENNYASCFENPALALLKEMHDEYGCCITLCCFVSSDNYSIQDVPSKFAAEFSANKDWLRFAFHGTTVQELFNTDMPDTIAEYYITFVNGIYKMTNDVDCIDRITRLSSFTGTLSNIKAIRDSACGVTGLLCDGTDNSYNSYYLSNDDNSYIRTHGKIYDSVNHMWLLSTQRRLEARDQVLDNFTGLALANFNPCIELFWHEDQATPAHTDTIAKIKSIMNWFNTNGYMNAFTADVLHIN